MQTLEQLKEPCCAWGWGRGPGHTPAEPWPGGEGILALLWSLHLQTPAFPNPGSHQKGLGRLWTPGHSVESQTPREQTASYPRCPGSLSQAAAQPRWCVPLSGRGPSVPVLRRMGGTEAWLLEGADRLGMSARSWAVEGTRSAYLPSLVPWSTRPCDSPLPSACLLLLPCELPPRPARLRPQTASRSSRSGAVPLPPCWCGPGWGAFIP